MFKETPDGQTHSYNDGCGEPAHNYHQTPCVPHGVFVCSLCNPQGVMTTSEEMRESIIKYERDILLAYTPVDTVEWHTALEEIGRAHV